MNTDEDIFESIHSIPHRTDLPQHYRADQTQGRGGGGSSSSWSQTVSDDEDDDISTTRSSGTQSSRSRSEPSTRKRKSSGTAETNLCCDINSFDFHRLVSKLGLRVGEDSFIVPEIRDLPLPREDGLQWQTEETFPQAVEARPYGHTYYADQQRRLQLLNSNAEYRFVNELAGAMKRPVAQMFDDEDWQRMQQERHQAQQRYELELQRTLQKPQEKYEMIDNLRKLKRITEETLEQNRARGLSLQLTLLAQRLFASTTGSKNDRGVALLELLRTMGFYQNVLLGQPLSQEQTEMLDLDERNDVAALWKRLQNEPIRRQLLLLLFLYYRDILNNMRQESHTVPQFIQRQLEHLISLYDVLELLPASEQPGGRAQLLQSVARKLAVPDPLVELEKIYLDKDPDAMDWQHQFANTETVRLDKWLDLKVPLPQEEELAQTGCQNDYGDLYPQYCQNMMAYLYGDTSERIAVQDEAIARGQKRLPLRWRSERAEEGGHPPAVVALIRRAVPDFFSAVATTTTTTTTTQKSSELAMAERVVRAHFLWLGFDSIRWQTLLDLVLGGQSQPDIQAAKTRLMNGTLHSALSPLETVLDSVWKFYEPLLLYYNTQLLDELQNHNVLALPPILLKQLQQLRQNPFTEDGLRQLQDLFQDMPLEQFIVDTRFKRYLETSGLSQSPVLPATAENSNKKRRLDQLGDLRVQQLEYPELHFFYVARQYSDYIESFTEELERRVEQAEQSVQSATERLNRLVGDETIGGTTAAASQPRPPYMQRKAFTSLAINSGLVHLRPEILSIISTAYFNVQRYCTNLKGLPLEAFKSDQAYECGLTTSFIKYIAAAYAYESLSYPETYKSQEQYRHNTQLSKDHLERLQRDFSYRRLYDKHYAISCSGQKKDQRTLQLQYFESLVSCGIDNQPLDLFNNGCF
jgi:hypothetical protein